MRTIIAQFLERKAETPDKAALIVGEQVRSYAGLECRARHIVARLHKLGGGRALRIGLALDDCAEFIELMLACLGGGHAAVIADPDWPAQVLAENLEGLDVDLLVAEAAAAAELADVLDGVQVLANGGGQGRAHAFESWLAEVEPGLDWPKADGSAPFLIGFTSGSTGKPKAFHRIEKSWSTSFAASDAEIPTGADDVLLCPGLMKHTLGLYAVLYALARGGLAIGSRRFGPSGPEDQAPHMLKLMQDHAVTQIALIPPMAHWLARAARQGNLRFDCVRQVTSTAMKLAHQTRTQLQHCVPNADIVEYYGAAETGFITISRPGEGMPDSAVGRAMTGVELSIRDAETGDPVPVGEVGQVHIRSTFTSLGYLVERDAGGFRVTPGGWATVGDLGRCDAEGRLTLVGRENELMISGGHKVYPMEIEKALADVAGLDVACVLGLPNPVWGDVVCVVVAPADLPTDDIARHCIATLPPERCPQVHFCASTLPRTPTGKIARAALRSALEQVHGDRIAKLTMGALRKAQKQGGILRLPAASPR